MAVESEAKGEGGMGLTNGGSQRAKGLTRKAVEELHAL